MTHSYYWGKHCYLSLFKIQRVIPFYILILADIHGNLKATKRLVKTLQAENKPLDLIIIAGDLPATTSLPVMALYMLTHPFQALSKRGYTEWVYKGWGRKYFVKKQIKSSNEILNILSDLQSSIIYIPGNVDTHDLIEEIEMQNRKNLTILSTRYLINDEYLVIGRGGAIIHASNGVPLCDHEYSEKEFAQKWSKIISKYTTEKASERSEKTSILISHEPPLLEVHSREKTVKIGSKAITSAIQAVDPNLVIFGHYHEFSLVKKVEITTYINPGPLACYYYAFVNIKGASIDCSLKRLQPAKFDSINKIYHKRTVENTPHSTIRIVK